MSKVVKAAKVAKGVSRAVKGVLGKEEKVSKEKGSRLGKVHFLLILPMEGKFATTLTQRQGVRNHAPKAESMCVVVKDAWVIIHFIHAK